MCVSSVARIPRRCPRCPTCARSPWSPVITAPVYLTYERPHGTDLAALVHHGEHVAGAQQQLGDFFGDLLPEAAAAGDLRDDVARGGLASYCLHALAAASSLPSKAAVQRLVTVTLDGLCAPRSGRAYSIGS